jgi:hypothetical protein
VGAENTADDDADLAEAVRWLDRLLAWVGPEHPGFLAVTLAAAFVHEQRCWLLGDRASRDSAIRWLAAAVPLLRTGVHDLAGVHEALARLLGLRYEDDPPAGGAEADLEGTIAHARAGLSLASSAESNGWADAETILGLRFF